MERLWAPWRIQLIEAPKSDGCIFCDYPARSDDETTLVLARSQHAFVILNRYPYNNGHLMVVPRRHAASPLELEEEEFLDLQRSLRLAIRGVEEAYGPEALNVGMNLGRAAGAGIADHLHWHIVPRWSGDVNFMPVLADTRVIPEHLDASWSRMRPIFDRLFAPAPPQD